MKGTIMSDFMVFIAGLIILVIILSTAFGKGVVANSMIYFSGANPTYLSEEFSLLLTTASYVPGDMVAGIKYNTVHNLEMVNEKDGYWIRVKDIKTPFYKNDNIPDANVVSANGVVYVHRTETDKILKIEGGIT